MKRSILDALNIARDALENARGNINPERGYADELEEEIEGALGAVLAAIAEFSEFEQETGNRARP